MVYFNLNSGLRLNMDIVKTYRSIAYAKRLLEKLSVPKLVNYRCRGYLQAVKDVMFDSSSDYMENVHTIGLRQRIPTLIKCVSQYIWTRH